MIRRSRKSSMTSKITQMETHLTSNLRRKVAPQSNSALNFSKRLRFWPKTTLGTAQNAKILFWLKNRCRSIKHLRYWLFVWRDLRESNITPKSITCKYFFISVWSISRLEDSIFPNTLSIIICPSSTSWDSLRIRRQVSPWFTISLP